MAAYRVRSLQGKKVGWHPTLGLRSRDVLPTPPKSVTVTEIGLPDQIEH